MILSCPICGNPLQTENRSLRCANRHSFDLAKSGYVNLLPGGGTHGDNDQMVKARTAFLSKGCYAFLRDQLKQELANEPVHTFADLGCGEGYYTSVIEAEEKYGFDDDGKTTPDVKIGAGKGKKKEEKNVDHVSTIVKNVVIALIAINAMHHFSKPKKVLFVMKLAVIV